MENRDKKELAQKSCKSQKMAKYKKWIRAEKAETSRAKNLGIQSKTSFTSKAKKAFTKLRQAFVETLILNHFDLKRHIQIETNASGYAINEIFSQLTLDDLGQWRPLKFFFQNMISIKSQYKTHDNELLAIIKAFKMWKQYLESCKHKVLVLTFTDHNNF